MTGPAMQKALNHVTEAFRPERTERSDILMQGHRVKALVEGKRYSFTEACRQMEVEPVQVLNAAEWLAQDNARLNARFNSSAHALTEAHLSVVAFMNHGA
jgi:hypothetical protein